nr:hypothetical protein [Verrucomicrobiota bacterium]
GMVGSIAWIDSVLSAVRQSWTTGQPGLHLLRRLPTRKSALWCFLDASRSTGMSRFLNSARDALAGLAQLSKPARFHLLALQNGELRWLARHATRSRFTSALLHLKAASGKSLIVEGLRQLDRAKLRAPASARDRVIISTDGLATPAPGEGLDQTRSRLRNALRRLAAPPTPLAWLYPAAARGLAMRRAGIFDGLRIDRFGIGVSSDRSGAVSRAAARHVAAT